MRYNGTIISTRQNKNSGKWSAYIKCAEFNYDLFYPMRQGEENTVLNGSAVSFEVRPDNRDPSKMSAHKLSVSGSASQANTRPAVRGNDSAKPSLKYYLPKDTSAILSMFGTEIENTALKTEKYIRATDVKEEKLKVVRAEDYSKAEQHLHRQVVSAQLGVIASFRYNHCITAALGSRMVLGLGGGGAIETGIILHHTYGFPYIPGSSLKGCLRSYIIRDLFRKNEDDAIENDDFIKVFGTQEGSGKVFFLDAYPANCRKLELDIMNPHYPEYYQCKTGPTDDQSPSPIKFYTVAKGTQFTFRLISNKLDIKRFSICGKPVPVLLSEMLQDIGIGSKTAVGYGWFSSIAERHH